MKTYFAAIEIRNLYDNLVMRRNVITETNEKNVNTVFNTIIQAIQKETGFTNIFVLTFNSI
jgi:nitrogen regulatory protein PII